MQCLVSPPFIQALVVSKQEVPLRYGFNEIHVLSSTLNNAFANSDAIDVIENNLKIAF